MTSTVSEDDDRWFFGKITSKEAEDILFTCGSDNGTFLVRESCSSPGNFVLSVMVNNEPTHHLICRYLNDAFFFLMTDDKRELHHGLDTLVTYYSIHPLIPSVGIVLTKSCLGDPPPHDARLHGSSNLLHRAVSQGNLIVVTELLKSGYRKIDARNNAGQTALHIACIKGQEMAIRTLLQSNASCLVRDQEGCTPLHHACRYNQPNVVRLLVTLGNADMQSRSAIEESVALHEAASSGSLECIKVLLELGAPHHPRNSNKETPADLAKQYNHMECYTMLVDSEVPKSKFTPCDYYHGKMTRSQASTCLTTCPGDGRCTFLVRDSQKSPYYFVLSLSHLSQVFHFQILRQDDFYFIDNGPYFQDVDVLIDHYTRFSDGLPCCLQSPVPPANPPSDHILVLANIPKVRESSNLDSSSDLQPLISTSTSQDDLLRMSLSQDTSMEVVPQLSINTEATSDKSREINNQGKIVQDLIDFESGPKNISCTSRKGKVEGDDLLVTTTLDGNKTDEIFGAIDVSSLGVGKTLGVGEFGSVYQGMWTTSSGDKVEVAVKTLRDNNNMNKVQFLREAKVMMNLNHPYIVKLLGVCHGPPVAMVQELAYMGSLLDFLLDESEQVDPDFHLKLWSGQVASGMKYLEEKHFVHRDLAARNLLLSSLTLIKISDFGLSRALDVNRDYYKVSVGGKWPLKWYAPESIYFGTFTHKSDVWSYGVILWEMYTYGDQPYGALHGSEVVDLIEKKERLPCPENCPASVYNVMLHCWSYKAEKRPSFLELFDMFKSNPDYINIKSYIK